jgi:predicted CXXCH cytochrome family protein
VYRPGKSLSQFVPGEDLDKIAVYFVRESEKTGGARATSQYEALLHSACKRAAGDKLTCTTCHDPHYEPTEAERVQYFRGICLSCHQSAQMAEHHPEQQDCARCHMPSRNTVDISHQQVTDHDIEARPADRPLQLAGMTDEVKLVPVGDVEAGDREYGLAYAQLAERGDRHAARTALELLAKFAQSLPAGSAPDVDVSVRLGYLWQIAGDKEKARAAYADALLANPYEPTALANLAVLDASTGQVQQGVRLLKRLIHDDPSRSAAGLNLAFIECKLGDGEDARELIQRLTMFNPDDPQLREFLLTGNYGGQHCALPNAKTAR